MKFPAAFPVSARILWELTCSAVGLYLLIHPALSHGQSIAVALGGGLALFYFKPLGPDFFSGMGRYWWFFLSFVLLSCLWSLSPGISLQACGFLFLGTFLYGASSGGKETASGRMEMVWMLAAGVAAVWAIDQRIEGFKDIAAQLSGFSGEEFNVAAAAVHNQRAFGPLATPGALAALMILLIPQAFFRAAVGTGARRIFFTMLTLLLTAGLFASQSMGALVCLTVSVLAVCWNLQLKKWVGAGLLFGAAGSVLLLFERGLQNWILAAFSMRLRLWKSALELFQQSPWFGTGFGTFGLAYQRAGMDLNSGSIYAHNLFLQLLVETGLVGTGLLIAALFSLAARFQKPSRWEGWGVAAGILAFSLFSLLDLPFQMPELVWFFSLTAGRLRARPEAAFPLPVIGSGCAQWVLLGVFLFSGFWPPFRPWNLALVAVAVWTFMAMGSARLDKIPLWICLGAFYLVWRAFCSPSAMGAVWFLETAGILLSFSLGLSQLKDPSLFMKLFSGLGLVWALGVWRVSFLDSRFEDWAGFPNPKQVAIFLMPLVWLLLRKPSSPLKISGVVFSILTMVRLRSAGVFLFLAAGWLGRDKVKSRGRNIFFLVLAAAMGIFLMFRALDSSSTKWDRLLIWKAAAQVWLRNPVEGVGPGAFAGYFHQVKSPRSFGVSRYLMDAQYAHNEYLDFLTAFGILGIGWVFFLFRKIWSSVQDPWRRSGLISLGAASLFDFCLHTPLVALQAVGLASGRGEEKKVSWTGGFLAFGIALGLFGVPIFAQILQKKSEALVSQGKLQEALKSLEQAEKLNAWDSRFPEARGAFLEKLFLATKDPVWRGQSDEVFERVLDLEKADGFRKFDAAERLTERLAVDPSKETEESARMAWAGAEEALPFNAFVRAEEGMFFLKEDSGTGGIARLPDDRERALADFQEAVRLEPYFSGAWVYAGLCLQKRGAQNHRPEDQTEARRDFATALDVYNRWKDDKRIDPLEVRLVGLDPKTVLLLEKEVRIGK